jgi:hypothetical protein
MLACDGSIPGPTLQARKDFEMLVDIENRGGSQ